MHFFGIIACINQLNRLCQYTIDRENRKANSGRKEVEMFEALKKAFRRYQRRKAERMKIRKTVKLAKINRTIC